MTLNRDSEGFLIDNSVWTKDIMRSMGTEDNFPITDEVEIYIDKAREMYAGTGTMPAIRHFAKEFGMNRKAKELYRVFETSPMRRIAQYGGLPKPTGKL